MREGDTINRGGAAIRTRYEGEQARGVPSPLSVNGAEVITNPARIPGDTHN